LRLGKVASIYFGGGTPSILPAYHLERIILTCFSSFQIQNEAEITIEVNPETIHRNELNEFKSAGFNRLSIGAQSFDDKLLKILGRKHSSEEISRCYFSARKAGFKNISLDLIFGIPGQNADCWFRTLEKAVELGSDHISAYCLEVHHETLLQKQINDGLFNLPDEDIQADMYLRCVEFLNEKGLIQYEISNFAKKGKKCKHNLFYWKNDNYLGFGAGAHSHVGNCRFKNMDNPIDYVKKLQNGEDVSEGHEELSSDMALSETMFLGLRLIEGINLNEFKKKFGFSLDSVYGEQIKILVEKGLLSCGKNLKLTKKGLFLANMVFTEFVSD